MVEKILISHFNGIWLYLEKEILSEDRIYYNILAKYNYSEAVYSFDSELVSGKLPKKQEMMVKAWIYMREEEIRAALHVWNEDGDILKINGLR
ncbi:MAG: DUF4160 domain-containing protein [Oscillospiraceae bacterium]|nr:DUF4160 domain-containing protein [Oscillospiraceae bacterium]